MTGRPEKRFGWLEIIINTLCTQTYFSANGTSVQILQKNLLLSENHFVKHPFRTKRRTSIWSQLLFFFLILTLSNNNIGIFWIFNFLNMNNIGIFCLKYRKKVFFPGCRLKARTRFKSCWCRHFSLIVILHKDTNLTDKI